MRVGGVALNRVDQSRGGINSDVVAHSIGEAFCAAVEPLLALGHRIHFGIPLLALVLVPPARSTCGLGKVELGALMIVASRIVPSLSIAPLSLSIWFTPLEDLLGNPVLFQQMAEAENRGLIRDPTFHRLDPCEAAEAGRIDQHLLHQGV